MPTHFHLIWKLRMSGVISPYAPSGPAGLPFCLPWFFVVSNNYTVDPHSLIIRGMRTEPLTGIVIGHVALPYSKTEYVSIELYFLALPYTDCWSKSRSEYEVCLCLFLFRLSSIERPRLWSSGQSFWLQIQRSRVRFPALPDFLSGSGSGTGSSQPREVN